MNNAIRWDGDIEVKIDNLLIKDMILEERADLEWIDDINYESDCWLEFKKKIEEECIKILLAERTCKDVEDVYHHVKDKYYVLWADVAMLFSLEDIEDPTDDEANEGLWNGSAIELHN